MTGGEEYRCYNTSCTSTFKEEDNNDSACTYHTGKPYFHDGYKEWSCCKLRSADFTTFLGFKGCTVGRHNKDKPEEPEPVDEAGDKAKEEEKVEEIKPEVIPYLPPEENHLELITLVENKNLVNAPTVNNSMICKNCKKDENQLDLSSACDYHRGIQM